MTASEPTVVFKPNHGDRVLWRASVTVSLMLVGVGLLCVFAAAPLSLSFVVISLGLLNTARAISSMLGQVIVTAEGIEKRTRIANGFIISWEDVDSWSVPPHRCRRPRSARFVFRGSLFSRAIFEGEVSEPGFDYFLREVRMHIPRKEVARPAYW